jgi:hypothetical protein
VFVLRVAVALLAFCHRAQGHAGAIARVLEWGEAEHLLPTDQVQVSHYYFYDRYVNRPYASLLCSSHSLVALFSSGSQERRSQYFGLLCQLGTVDDVYKNAVAKLLNM